MAKNQKNSGLKKSAPSPKKGAAKAAGVNKNTAGSKDSSNSTFESTTASNHKTPNTAADKNNKQATDADNQSSASNDNKDSSTNQNSNYWQSYFQLQQNMWEAYKQNFENQNWDFNQNNFNPLNNFFLNQPNLFGQSFFGKSTANDFLGKDFSRFFGLNGPFSSSNNFGQLFDMSNFINLLTQFMMSAGSTGFGADAQKLQEEFARQFFPVFKNIDFGWDSIFSAFNSSNKDFSNYLNNFMHPFQDMLSSQPDFWSKFIAGDTGVLIEYYQKWWQKVYQGINRQFTLGKLGLHREANQQILQLIKSQGEMLGKYIELQLEYYKCGKDIVSDINIFLMQKQKDPNQISSFRELYVDFIKIGEDHIQKLYVKPSFLAIQGSYLQSYLAYKKEHDNYIYTLLKDSPFASKRELDDANLEIYKLKQQLNKIKKQFNTKV